MKKTILLCAIAAMFSACGPEQNEDVVQQPDKNGSIETIVAVTHGTNCDVLTTTHKVWVKGVLDKTITTSDTLKSLGNTVEEATSEEDDDGNVNTKNVVVPKDYELYITVK